VDFEKENLELELAELGATSVQRESLRGDVARARAAIAQAYDRGAGNPLAYALSLYRSEAFQPEAKAKPRAVNQHGRDDPTRTDEGERIWQWHEVDDSWRKGYLLDCWQAFQEGREPAARYQPSEAEFDAVKDLHAPRLPISVLNPTALHTNAERALRAWAEVWGVALPERESDDLDLTPDAERVLAG
jgi:hypothetical protein